MNLSLLEKIKNKKITVIIAGFFLILLVIYFFDKGLATSLFLLFILSCLAFFILYRIGFKDKKIYLLFAIVLIIRLVTTLFMHYANFQPFSGGGDDIMYQKSAVEASQCFKQGDFIIKDIVLKYPDFYTGHCFPVVIGALYALTLPELIIGLMLNVWLAAITVVFVYLIVLEIGGLEENAFRIGLIVALYPSYIFNAGLLLKDTIEICFAVLSLLFLIKVIKKFNWLNFFILYLVLICATNLRFYLGYALIGTFIISWFLLSKVDFKKRIKYGILFIIILGFIPQISTANGYYGINSFRAYINSEKVNFYRNVAYNPIYRLNLKALNLEIKNGILINSTTGKIEKISNILNDSEITRGTGSSFSVGNGVIGYVESFTYVLIGPLPWQIKNLRQLLALMETFPWYLMIFFVVDGIIICYKKHIKEAFPLLIFSAMVLVVISVFTNNYGNITRIRIPAFVSLLCIASFGFNKNNLVYNYLEKKYEKISSYRWGRIHRV